MSSDLVEDSRAKKEERNVDHDSITLEELNGVAGGAIPSGKQF